MKRRLEDLDSELEMHVERLEKAPRGSRGAKAPRMVQRTANIYIGGTGCATGSRVMKLLESQHTSNFVRHLAFDTDESSRNGVPNGRPYKEGEFRNISLDRVGIVCEHPDRHPALVKQTGLDDTEAMNFHRKLTDDKLGHAGQVRSFGFLGCMADIHGIRVAIQNTLDELVRVDSMLIETLKPENAGEINKSIVFNLFFSIGGGTGSSMALAIASMIRAMTSQLNVEIVAYMVMPEAFVGVLDDKPEQIKRVYANAYTFMQELEAARSGLLEREGARVGIEGFFSCPIPPNVFSQVITIGNTDATGSKVEDLDALLDALATYTVGLIGTELNDRVTADRVNHQSAMQLTADPTSKKPRYLATIGSRCLAVGKDRIAKHLAARYLVELYDMIEGQGYADPKDLETEIASSLHGVQGLVNSITGLFSPTRALVTRELYARVTGNQKEYVRNSVFLERMANARRNWLEKTAPTIQSKVREKINEQKALLITALDEKLTILGESKGAIAQEEFLRLFTQRLRLLAETLSSEAKADEAVAKRHVEKLSEMLAGLSGMLNGMLTNKSKQEAAAGFFSDACNAASRALIKNAVAELAIDLLSRTNTWSEGIQRKIGTCQSRRSTTIEVYRSTKASQYLTTESKAELDLGSKELDAKLYKKYALDFNEFINDLAVAWQTTNLDAKRLLVGEADSYRNALEMAEKHFEMHLRELSITDVLADLLSNEDTKTDATIKLRHVLETAQPLWVSEAGHLAVTYSDMLLVGLPSSLDPERKKLVESAIHGIDPSRFRADGQYNEKLSLVETGDNSRLYVIRRTTGALWHYMPEIHKAKEYQRAWESMGGHSTSIFNKRIVAKFESLVPEAIQNEGELAMALGLAYGWIAIRGAHAYDNLSFDENQKLWIVRLASGWNGIAFQGSKLRTDDLPSSVRSLLESGRMHYDSKRDPEKAARIGQGFEEAYETVVNNGELIEKILEAFDTIRTNAGDLVVIQDLEAYIVSLKERSKPKDGNYKLVMRMVDVLGTMVANMRSENR